MNKEHLYTLDVYYFVCHPTLYNVSDLLEFAVRESKTGLKFVSVQTLVKLSEVLKLKRK